MPKKVPSEYTGRFSVKPKKSGVRTKDEASASPSREKEPAPPADSLRDEPVPFQERKRKLSGNVVEEGEAGTLGQTRDDAEGLNTYSQQLEVQPPTKKRRFHITEQIDLQGQHISVTGDSVLNDFHQEVSGRAPGTFPGPPETHQYHQEALVILRDGWQCRGPAPPDIQGIAQTLAERATNVPDAGTMLFPRFVPRAIMDYASQVPQAIDYMLQAFSVSLQLLPDSLTKNHGGGTDATITQLKWLLIQEIHGFSGFLLPNSPAIIDSEDHSNIRFRHDSVSSNLEGVLAQIRDWKWQRTIWFVAATSQARCFSLDILRKKVGQQIEALIDAGLNRKQKRWSKVDMLGACILLRGCAKSLKAHVPTSKIKIFAWKEVLEKFMLQDEQSLDNDFVIKAHAALALTNLIDGPFDETSEQIFAPGSWVF